jgi:hypothetical protein
MNAQDLATYFAKKIAQPIPFDYLDQARGIRTQRSYLVEAIAVEDDNVLHAMVTLKREILLEGGCRFAPSPSCTERSRSRSKTMIPPPPSWSWRSPTPICGRTA